MELSGRRKAEEIEIEHKKRVEVLIVRGIMPKLVIIQTIESKVIDVYVNVKKKYAQKIGVEVLHVRTQPQEVKEVIAQYNDDATVHGIIVQLPLDERLIVQDVLGYVSPKKAVDGLTPHSPYVPPTAQAIYMLLQESGRNISTEKIALVGHGTLVGRPTESLLVTKGIYPHVFIKGDDLNLLQNYTTIISGTGIPGLILSQNVAEHTLVIDAGTAEDSGSIVGDVEEGLYARTDITVSAKKGGVGLLTVRGLFENVLTATEIHTAFNKN